MSSPEGRGAAEELLDRFAAEGWASEPNDAMLALAPEDRFALAVLALDRLERSTTFLDHALSLVDEEQFATLADRAVESLAARPRTGDTPAESVIAYASLQVPHVLAPHLEALWDLAPNERAYYALWPWRASPPAERERLLGLRGERAFRALIETRDPETILRAVALEPRLPYGVDDYLRLVAYELGGDGGGDATTLRRLAPDRCLHLALPPEVAEHRQHPTWTDAGRVGTARFGGGTEGACGWCGHALHRLVDLDPVPDGLGVTSRARLELATCLSCGGWEVPLVFCTHDADGTAHGIRGDRGLAEPQWPAAPLLEAEVAITATPPRWLRQDWALSNSRENLNRLGGEPAWIQNPDFPACPGCGTTMTALLQLDSELTTQDGGEWLWGSGGIGYLSWCDGCAISAMQSQCT